ncbi:hypothetical protein F4780DRAFT_779096 [Xylariomycetidae sp. FL0641]|nr:hypothetical protein F4780DRAFT_779096 [Xylariomycetidae sp. FL0641]
MYSLVKTFLATLPLALAAPSGLDPRDSNPGCQAASFGSFAWTVENFVYNASYIFTTPAHQNSWGYVNFDLRNPALAYDVACRASSSQLNDFFYGNVPYTCSSSSAADNSSSTTETTFSYSRPSGQLNVNQTWVCSDRDPLYPTTFHAYGTANLSLSCTDETTNNPDWEIGQIYSDRQVDCKPVTLPLKPYEITAVA